MKLSQFIALVCFLCFSCENKPKNEVFELKSIESPRILKHIDDFKNLKPITVTDSFCKRSAGTIHDFYSEGDYWWPNPDEVEGAYIRRDGLSNPDNFKAHRKAVIRLNHISGKLASAYILTQDENYLKALIPHLEAWFVNADTKMNPNLLYAQAIKGIATGRGIGIIDTVHLVEVAMAIKILKDKNLLKPHQLQPILQWFKDYLNWLTTHPFGIKERDNGNNHSVCWALQVAAFAKLVEDESLLDYCRHFFKSDLLPNQMAVDGSFPKELSRTKPYGYALFNLDAMANLCQILSTEDDNLFNYKTSDQKSIKLGMEFMYPYIKDKSIWPYPKDVMYFDDWPVRQSALLFSGTAYKNSNYLELWRGLNSEFKKEEIERNMPAKYPLLWY
jgi:hypothetical protein